MQDVWRRRPSAVLRSFHAEVRHLAFDDSWVGALASLGKQLRPENVELSATSEATTYIKSTKTGRVRLVSLTAEAVHALREHRARAELTALGAGRMMEPVDMVFTSDPSARRPWRPELVTRRSERLRDRAGLTHVRIHDLRHFVATELLNRPDRRPYGRQPPRARPHLDHLDIYWAWVPARDRDAAAHLEVLLGSGREL
ncbi:MAG: tyrosine-type recombinase/integrase [Acidimicrobiales bacterium]